MCPADLNRPQCVMAVFSVKTDNLLTSLAGDVCINTCHYQVNKNKKQLTYKTQWRISGMNNFERKHKAIEISNIVFFEDVLVRDFRLPGAGLHFNVYCTSPCLFMGSCENIDILHKPRNARCASDSSVFIYPGQPVQDVVIAFKEFERNCKKCQYNLDINNKERS